MAARILEKLSLQKTHGLQVLYIVRQLFQEGFVCLLHRGDDGNFVNALDEDACTPERIWNEGIKNALAACVEKLAKKAFAHQTRKEGGDWFAIPEDFQFTTDEIAAHPELGGVYLDLYLKDPRFPLSYPRKFLEALLKQFVEIGVRRGAGAGASGGVVVDRKELGLQLSSAMINLFIAQPQMIEHAVTLGYMASLVAIIAPEATAVAEEGAEGAGTSTEIRGGSLRIIHQMVNSPTGAQALATCSKPYAVSTLMTAMDWNLAGSILALETLKRALGAGNRSRDVLVAQSMSSGLIQKLINMLNWQAGTASGTDGDAASRTASSGAASGGGSSQSIIALDSAGTEKGTNRVLCIEVLKLLALEGSRYGGQIQEKLNAVEAWSHYRDQKLDLFLPQGAAESSTGVVGALAGGTLENFALPAPQTRPPPDSNVS